jgi:hypothetical protein
MGHDSCPISIFFVAYKNSVKSGQKKKDEVNYIIPLNLSRIFVDFHRRGMVKAGLMIMFRSRRIVGTGGN